MISMNVFFTAILLTLMFFGLIFYNENRPFQKDIPYLKIEQKRTAIKKRIRPTRLNKKKSVWQIKNFDTTSGSVQIFFLDFTATQKPKNDCETKACKFLLRKINDSKESIDFAIYGIENQPKLFRALIDAQDKGVLVRWVTDFDWKDENIYADTKFLAQKIQTYKSDNPKTVDDFKIKAPRTFASALMHNKFFIFDKKSVWTSSSNLTHTDLSGFNANTAIYINSEKIAEIYLNEFENLYQGKFHTLKPPTGNNETINVDDKNTVSVYFSPNDLTITNKIIPLIENAQKYVYIPMFFLTHKPLKDSLIKLHKRGVEVKIILDATSASNKYSIHKELRDAGIKLKVENLAGKIHCKSIIIDDKYLVLGSMNLTKNGEIINDENTLIIENHELTRVAKAQFLYYWKFIPDKWLTKTPSAESFSSIGSCNDGIDNDYDGKTDSQDTMCQSKHAR